MLRTIRFCSSFARKFQSSLANGVRHSHPHPNCLGSSSIKMIKTSYCSHKSSDLFDEDDEDTDDEENMKLLSAAWHKNYQDKKKNEKLLDIIKSYKRKIKWDEVISKSVEANANTNRDLIKANIIHICEKEKLFDALKSYLKYLIEKRDLCAGSLYFFCKAIAGNREHMKECEEIIYKIYLKLTPNDVLLLEVCLMLLLGSETYRKKVLNKQDVPWTVLKNFHQIIDYSLEHNDEETAFEYLKKCKREYPSKILNCFLKHFIRNAEKGIVPFPQFATLFDIVSQNMGHFNAEAEDLLDILFSALNKIDKSHVWIRTMTKISENKCKVCHGELMEASVTSEEIEILKNRLKEDIIVQDNINISSNKVEWERFQQFLKKRYYNIVLDGLNLHFTFKKSANLFMEIMKTLDNLGKIPLIMARKHFHKTAQYKVIEKRFPVFLTDNLSHDDPFVLYAALNMGKGCFALSKDQMGFMNNIESKTIRDIFSRWQATHQCYFTFPGKVVSYPVYVGGVNRDQGSATCDPLDNFK